MKGICFRKRRRWRKQFFCALENLLIREGFHTRLHKRDRVLRVHEAKGYPAVATVSESADVRVAGGRQDSKETLDTILKSAVNALEIADAVCAGKRKAVYYPDTRKDKMRVIAVFGRHHLLCRKNSGIFTGYSFLVWEEGAPALYRNIFYDYEEAKEQFAKQSNLVYDWLDYAGVRALGCAVRYYLDNAEEHRTCIMESLKRLEQFLLRVSGRGTNGLYGYAFDLFDRKLEPWMSAADSSADAPEPIA